MPATKQVDLILSHLHQIDPETGKFRGITRWEAEPLYRVASLSRRITDLRKRGYKVRAEHRVDPTGRRYVRYFLEQ